MAAQTIGVSSWQTTNEGANQSTVYVGMTLYSNGWSFDGYTTYYGLRIGDQWSTGAATRTLYSPNTWYVEWSRTYTHDTNGYRGDISTEAYFDGTGPYMPDYLSGGGGTQGAINYDRKPASVTGTSATVNADKSITVTFGGGGSPGGSPALSSTYNLQYSQNGGGFVSAGTGNSPRVITGLTPGANYVFRAYATNQSNDGAGGYSDSASVFLPSGGKRYNGSSYIATQTAKRFDGSTWQTIVTAKRYNGSTWVNLS